jgi:hypothetical protein
VELSGRPQARRAVLDHVIQHMLFPDIDEYVPFDRFEAAGPLDLAWMENRVASGKDKRPPPRAERFQNIERPGIQTGEGIVYQG